MKLSLIAIVCLSCLLGCQTAGERSQAVVENVVKEVVFKITDAAKIDQSTMSAGGKAINPSYEFAFFGGTGFYSSGYVRAVGVELTADLAAGGSGTIPVDHDLREKLYATLNRKDIGDEERKQLIADVVAAWVKAKATTQPAGKE